MAMSIRHHDIDTHLPIVANDNVEAWRWLNHVIRVVHEIFHLQSDNTAMTVPDHFSRHFMDRLLVSSEKYLNVSSSYLIVPPGHGLPLLGEDLLYVGLALEVRPPVQVVSYEV